MAQAFAASLNQQLGIAAFNGNMLVTIVQTRDTDVNLSLCARANVARDSAADLFISLHYNATDPPGQARGVETFIRRPDINVNEEEDRSFAQRVQTAVFDTINNLSPTDDRGVREAGHAVLNDAQLGNTAQRHPCRACLLETEFIDHPDADDLLNGPNAEGVRDAIAEAVANAIIGELRTMP